MVSASARGRSNQRKGGYHERKQGKRLGELTGFTFERNLEQPREAAFVSRAAYAAPPRSGFPAKSALPDGVDEVTVWQMVSAYLKGEIENLPSDETKAPRPSAKQITRAEVMLELWHHVALIDKGDRKRLKRAVYLKASGMRPRAVQELTGLNYQQLWKAQKDACSDVWEKIMQLSQLGG